MILCIMPKKNVHNMFICTECGVFEYCEASLIFHIREKHNVQNADIKEPYMSRILQNDITLKDRICEMQAFQA